MLLIPFMMTRTILLPQWEHDGESGCFPLDFRDFVFILNLHGESVDSQDFPLLGNADAEHLSLELSLPNVVSQEE